MRKEDTEHRHATWTESKTTIEAKQLALSSSARWLQKLKSIQDEETLYIIGAHITNKQCHILKLEYSNLSNHLTRKETKNYITKPRLNMKLPDKNESNKIQRTNNNRTSALEQTAASTAVHSMGGDSVVVI